MIPRAFSSRIRALRKKEPWPTFGTTEDAKPFVLSAYNTALSDVEDALDDGSVLVRLTPSQAMVILVNMEVGPGLGWGRDWRSAHNGAEGRVRNALIDAGWVAEGRNWVKNR